MAGLSTWVYPDDMSRKCKGCDKTFVMTKQQFRAGKQFCEFACSLKHRQQVHAENTKDRICANDNCNRTDIKGRGLCRACYGFWRMHFTKSVQFTEILCPTCNVRFGTNSPRKFCSHECYVRSDQFKEQTQRHIDRMLAMRVAKQCLQCSKPFTVKPSRAGALLTPSGDRSREQKFCDKRCFRKYYADRFDRMVATNTFLELPCSYDEFLDQETLPCLLQGCDWSGKNLSTHCNYAHGITAAELKALLGFNRGTGLVVAETATVMSQNAAIEQMRRHDIAILKNRPTGQRQKKLLIRAEGREHMRKARALQNVTQVSGITEATE